MEVYLVDGVRTPFCRAGTALEPVPPQELGRQALRELVERTEVDPHRLDAVVAGNVAGPIDAANVARVVALEAGVPESVPAHTVSRNCASGMEAVVQAARLVRTGEAGLVAALGIESMSRIPVVFPDAFRGLLGRVARARSVTGRLRAWSGLRPRHLRPVVALMQGLTDPVSGLNMGETAELLAREFGISREAQDAYARRSHERALAARGRGVLAAEIAPVWVGPGHARPVAEDIGPREGVTLDKLARLRPVFDRERGTVTAGNSSQITDGAVALLVASEEATREHGLAPLARIRSHAVAGLDPRRMGLGPAFAVPVALERAGIALADVDLVELNEAFAVQVLACIEAFASRAFAERELGRSEPVGELDPDRLNVNGGAIALGHPVGASGARLLLTLARELERRRARLGLATLCVGGGQGQAMVLESAA